MEKIAQTVAKANIKRLVIDSIATVKFISDDSKSEKRDITRFIRRLKDLGCTTLILSELTAPNEYSIEQFAAHGVIYIHHFLKAGEMVRAIQIIKMRATQIDTDLFKINFTPKGIELPGSKVE